jgi:hypothetical protein
VPRGPVRRLRLHDPALDGGEQRLAFGERQADVFGPLGRLLEGSDRLPRRSRRPR